MFSEDLHVFVVFNHQAMTCWIVSKARSNAFPLVHLTIGVVVLLLFVYCLFVLVIGAPCTLIEKKLKHSITRAGGVTFKGPTFLPHLYVPMGGSVLEV